MDLKKTAINGARWVSISTIVAAVVAIVKLAILTRFLEGADFGVLAVMTMVTGFVMIFSDMGIPMALLHAQNLKTESLSTLFWINMLVSVGLAVLIGLLSPLVAWFYREPDLVRVLSLAGIELIPLSVIRIYATMAQKQFRFRRYAILSIVQVSLSLLITVILAWMGYAYYSMIWGLLVSSTLTALIWFVMSVRVIPIRCYMKPKEVNGLFRIGAYGTGASLLDFFSYQIDVFLIGRLLGMEALGLYNLAKQLAVRPFQLINNIIAQVGTPILSEIQDDVSRMGRVLTRLMKLTSYWSVPFYAFVAVFAPWIVTFVYSAEYMAMAPLLSWLCLWGMAAATYPPSGSALRAMGRTRDLFRWTGIRMVLSMVAVFLAALGTLETVAMVQGLLAVLLILVYYRVIVRPVFPISLRNYFGALLLTLSYTIPLLVLLALGAVFLPEAWPVVVRLVLVGLVYLGVLAWLWLRLLPPRFRPEWAWLRG